MATKDLVALKITGVSCNPWPRLSVTLALVEDLLENFGTPSRLEELSLVGNGIVTMDIVRLIADKFKNLRSLELEISEPCDPSIWIRLAISLRELEHLKVVAVYPDFFDDRMMSPVAINLNKLRSVAFETLYPARHDLRNLSQLSNLKHLRIQTGFEYDEALLAWKETISPNLESFSILGRPQCVETWKAALEAFLGSASNLRRLNLDLPIIDDVILRCIADSCPFLRELRVRCYIPNSLDAVQDLIDHCRFLKWLQIGSIEETQRYVTKLKVTKYRKINFRKKDTAAAFGNGRMEGMKEYGSVTKWYKTIQSRLFRFTFSLACAGMDN